VIVGWLEDGLEAGRNYVGGAELTSDEFRIAGLERGFDIELVPAQSDEVPEVDVWIVQNCVEYEADWIEVLESAPVVKYVHDVWPHGDPGLRSYLLASAQLIFCSPAHVDRFPYTLPKNVREPLVIPPAVDVGRFLAAGASVGERKQRGLYLAHNAKGLGNVQLAERELGIEVDVYGHPGPVVDYRTVPALMAEYEWFIYQPSSFEPFGRTIVEAWAAGCKLWGDHSDTGARWWIERLPECLDAEWAARAFWQTVEKTAMEGVTC
jgi:hypothetical protein